jgi:hypothetical protein
MNDVKWERYGALGGLIFVVLLLVSGFIPGSPPAPDDSAREIHEYFRDNDTAIKVASYLAGLAIFPFLFFLGSLWSRVRTAGDDVRRLATILVGGAVVAVGLASVSTVITATTALRIGELAPDGAKFFFTMAGISTSMTAFAVAAFVGATSLAALRSGVFPAWIGTAGAVLTPAWLVAGVSVATDTTGIGVFGFIVFLLWLAWVVVVSVFLFRSQQQAVARTP